MNSRLKSINISNFKLYKTLNDGAGVSFAIPDGTPGSGLTVLIGENNSGKSTVVSALAKLKDDSRIYDIEKNELNKPTEITFFDGLDKQTTLRTLGGGSSVQVDGDFSYDGIEVVKETRVWESHIQTSHMDHYSYLSSYDTNREVVDHHLASRLANLQTANDGTYSKFNEVFRRIIPEFEDWTITSHSPGSGDRIGYMVNGRNLEIDTSIGSGMLNLFRIVLALVSDNNLVAIDEPEVFLHPRAQVNLCNEMLEASSDKQIIYTTHSPYMFSSALNEKVKIYSFKEGGIEDISAKIQSDLISWNYLSWVIFGVRSNELHIELFDKLLRMTDSRGIRGLDAWIQENSSQPRLNRSSNPTKDNYGSASWPTAETLPVWIRNYMHHPELNDGGSKSTKLGYYRTSPKECHIDESINFMIEVLS